MSRRPARLAATAVEILESLYQHRLLSTSQIRELHLPGAGRRFTQQTLARLRQAGLADRVQLPGGLGVWFLTAAGISTVEEIPGRVETRRPRMDAEQAAGPLQAHTLAVNTVGIAFAKLARNHGDDFGPFAWRHEVAHPLDRVGRRRQRVIADAVLNYQAVGDGGLKLHYRFLELDRANRPADDLAKKVEQYARLYRLPGLSAGKGVPSWKDRYRVFPSLLVVLAGLPPAALERRRTALLLIARREPELEKADDLDVSVCLLSDLVAEGPGAAIFRSVRSPDRATDWLGEFA